MKTMATVLMAIMFAWLGMAVAWANRPTPRQQKRRAERLEERAGKRFGQADADARSAQDLAASADQLEMAAQQAAATCPKGPQCAAIVKQLVHQAKEARRNSMRLSQRSQRKAQEAARLEEKSGKLGHTANERLDGKAQRRRERAERIRANHPDSPKAQARAERLERRAKYLDMGVTERTLDRGEALGRRQAKLLKRAEGLEAQGKTQEAQKLREKAEALKQKAIELAKRDINSPAAEPVSAEDQADSEL